MKRSMASDSSLYNKRTRPWPGALMVVGIVCTLIIAVFAHPATSYADSIPGGNISDPVVRAVDIAKPSIVRIITALPSRLTVHMTQGDVTFPQADSTSQYAQNGVYVLQVSGSGAFITSQGDILTADHVVNPPKDQEMTQFLDRVAADDVAKYMNAHGNQVTADQVEQQLNSGQLRSTPSFDQAVSEVFLSTDYTGPLTATRLNDIPQEIHKTVDKIKMESAVNQKDVAIIHAPFTDTPSIQLGDSSTVQAQDELTIIGFPGNGDVSNKPTDLLTSSVNKINVSSIKSTDNGAPLIQVGGNVEQGDSGGPALDSEGNVVGIVSFGIASTPGAPAGTSFLQASNSARDLVKSAGLDTTPGTFQKLWSQSFIAYAAKTPGHWTQAKQGFTKLSKDYPLFKAVTRYLDYASTQAKNEPKSQATPQATSTTGSSGVPAITSWQALAMTVGAVAVLILLAVLLFGVATRRNKKKPGPPANGQMNGNMAPNPVPTMNNQQAPQGPPVPKPDQTWIAPGKVPANQGANPGMAAFGAPQTTAPSVHPGQPSQTLPRPMPPMQPNAPVSGNSGTFNTLRVWPCGHMNRSNARFCSICGEPAPPPPPVRRFEQ